MLDTEAATQVKSLCEDIKLSASVFILAYHIRSGIIHPLKHTMSPEQTVNFSKFTLESEIPLLYLMLCYSC